VIAGARQQDEIVQREVFGPVVSITPFDDAEQVIQWANDSDYGLASSMDSRCRPGDAGECPAAIRLHLG
jgi:aminobutyraldehyde dehydrogenase